MYITGQQKVVMIIMAAVKVQNYVQKIIKENLCVTLKIAFNKEEFLMIGDTVHDSEVAKALDIDCILVARGDQHKDTLLKTGYKIFDSLGEVLIYFKERYNF